MDTNAGVVGQAAVDNILAHFGVKGQKWGVRRSQKSLDRAAGRNENDPRFMSDAELRSRLSRMQMEKQYKELTKAPPTVSQKGAKFVGKIMTKVAEQTASSLTKSYADKYTAAFLAGNVGKGSGPSLPPVQGPLRPPKPGGQQ